MTGTVRTDRGTAVACEDIRTLLPEHAVGALSAEDERRLARHLDWCAGCRKEGRELTEGAATLAPLLRPVEPPTGLEGRILRATAQRRRSRTAIGSLVAAALLAGALGWGVAMAGRAQRAEDAVARGDATLQSRLFARLLGDVGAGARSALLRPSAGAAGGGRAILAPGRGADDLSLVIVGGLPEGRGPFRAFLVTEEGRRPVGRLWPSGAGQLAAYRFFPSGTVGSVASVIVADRGGRAVLIGDLGDGPG